MRRCVGCGRIAPKAELARLALDDGRVVADPTASRSGRGAYVCGPECLARAVRRRALGRAFRSSVAVSSDLVESKG
jgi:predicted RNA-binding protein YlxR (DUF448 family)